MENWCISTNWILEDFYYVFPFLILNCVVLYLLVIRRILIDLLIFIIKIFFSIKKSVLAFKNMFPPLYLCRLFICHVDTHIESHAIEINYVAICSRSKFNLTGLYAPVQTRAAFRCILFSLFRWMTSAELNITSQYSKFGRIKAFL